MSKATFPHIVLVTAVGSVNVQAPAARGKQQTLRGTVATARTHSGTTDASAAVTLQICCHSTDLHTYLLVRVSELGRYAHVTDKALF